VCATLGRQIGSGSVCADQKHAGDTLEVSSGVGPGRCRWWHGYGDLQIYNLANAPQFPPLHFVD